MAVPRRAFHFLCSQYQTSERFAVAKTYRYNPASEAGRLSRSPTSSTSPDAMFLPFLGGIGGEASGADTRALFVLGSPPSPFPLPPSVIGLTLVMPAGQQHSHYVHLKRNTHGIMGQTSVTIVEAKGTSFDGIFERSERDDVAPN